MTGFLRVAKLDYFTMKSQRVSYLTLIAVILMFGFMGSTVTILGITGAWFMALMASNIFAIQEKNGLDRLYGSVSVKLNEIVLGRYVFVLLHYLISFIAVLLVCWGFALFRNMAFTLSDILIGFSLSLLAFSIITGIQMPMFFKMGYTKAKGWSMVPFVAVMALVVVPTFVSALSGFVEYIMLHSDVLIVGGILASCVIQFISYRVAVSAYRKRKRG